jgi:hypothetical protein
VLASATVLQQRVNTPLPAVTALFCTAFTRRLLCAGPSFDRQSVAGTACRRHCHLIFGTAKWPLFGAERKMFKKLVDSARCGNHKHSHTQRSLLPPPTPSPRPTFPHPSPTLFLPWFPNPYLPPDKEAPQGIVHNVAVMCAARVLGDASHIAPPTHQRRPDHTTLQRLRQPEHHSDCSVHKTLALHWLSHPGHLPGASLLAQLAATPAADTACSSAVFTTAAEQHRQFGVSGPSELHCQQHNSCRAASC